MGASNMPVNPCACGAEARPGQRTCGPCHASYMRQWRAQRTKLFHAMKEELERLKKPKLSRA